MQGFPNLFKVISDAIDAYPGGTVFSQSFGVSEATFGGAEQGQTARFDAVYKKGIAKGDTFFASSGDDGTTGTSKQHRDTTTFPDPTVGWPASSPYVTAVGGTQLQDDWTWNPVEQRPVPVERRSEPVLLAVGMQGGGTEAVWNESWGPIATGGGPSEIYPRPGYQDSVAGSIPGNHRGVPDVAWNAAVNGGVLVYTSFYPDTNRTGWHIYGGTSASSPQTAALVALANEQRGAKGGLGNINPVLYTAGEQASNYHDIVPQHYGSGQGADVGYLRNNELYAQNSDGSNSQPGPVHGWPTNEWLGHDHGLRHAEGPRVRRDPGRGTPSRVRPRTRGRGLRPRPRAAPSA